MGRGAKLAASPKEVAQQSDVVFTMVGFPHDGAYLLLRVLAVGTHLTNGREWCPLLTTVRSVILGSSGVLEGLRSDGVVVDMTTSEPSLALDIYNEAKKKGVHSIDAPVSGSRPPPLWPHNDLRVGSQGLIGRFLLRRW